MNERATEYDLNKSQLEQLIDRYINTVVDSMSLEDLQDKLYHNLYNPKDGVAQTKVDVSALYDIQTEKDLSEDDEIKELNFTH